MPYIYEQRYEGRVGMGSFPQGWQREQWYKRVRGVRKCQVDCEVIEKLEAWSRNARATTEELWVPRGRQRETCSKPDEVTLEREHRRIWRRESPLDGHFFSFFSCSSCSFTTTAISFSSVFGHWPSICLGSVLVSTPAVSHFVSTLSPWELVGPIDL